MDSIWIVIQVLIGFNLVLPIGLYSIYSLRIRWKRKVNSSAAQVSNLDYAIIVTAYEETSLLVPLVDSILKLNYANYLVYIVADNCDVSNLNFASEKVILLHPETVLANNVKSHFYAIDHFRRNHEVLTIIDSDNLVDPEYLNVLNQYFSIGYQAVQGTRLAKKTHSTIARLDYLRDIYYHFYDGKLLFELGSSSTLSGSGMAFKTALYVKCLSDIEVEGAGFDKVLQAKIVMLDERIAFAGGAIVYDEKTHQAQQLVKQRSRWINTWFKYFYYGFTLIKAGFKNRSVNQCLFGLIVLRPPLFIFISLSLCCLLISIGLGSLHAYWWLLALFCFFFSFYVALRNSRAVDRLYGSLLGIPRFVLLQFQSLLFVRKANKRSIATKHQVDV